MSSINEINTKLEAYRLVHDPTRLFCLLYSKYGDIEEDLNYLYLNQILYNRSSHYNIIFKEYQYNDTMNEFLKRFYFIQESINRIPKLNDYYKNYHQFFCKPTFRNSKISEIMHNYGDNKAEIFYKNNYATTNDDNEEKEDSHSETSLSSLDNITNNKIIFNKNNRYIIDNNITPSKCTLTLDTSRTLKSNLNLLTKRSKDDSFIKSISPLINFNGVFGPKKKEKKKQNKTSSNTNRNRNYKNTKKKLISKENVKQNNNIKSSLYTLVRNNLNCQIVKNNKNKVIMSHKLKPYLTNYKSNFEEFNKYKANKNKDKIINGEEKTKNKTYNNSNNMIEHTTNMNSNFRNFSKLSETLNNNLNNKMNFSNTNYMTSNINTKNKNTINNNGSHSKSKQNKIPNGNNKTQHSNINSSNNTNHKIKNKTFDIKNCNPVISLSKFNSNSNFSNFNHQQNTMRNKKKNNYGSNFNLVKSPLSSINGVQQNSSKTKVTKVSKNKTYNNHNNSKNSLLSNPSTSIPKNSFSKKEKNKNTKEKKINNNNNNNNKIYQRKNNISSSNSINMNNIVFSSQRSTSNTSNTNILSPKNGINSNRMINLNNIYNFSRNKKNMITHTQTNVKTFRKDPISHKSVDEEKIKLKNILFNINKRDHNYQMSQRLANQIEELIKKSKISSVKYNGLNSNNDNLKNLNLYNGNEKGSKKSVIENSISSVHNGSNKSMRGNSTKPINVNLNFNMRVNSEDRKEKIIRVISPKK